MPDSLLVLGGGAIGAELAQVFARFGATVTVIEGAGQLLPLEEPEAGALLAAVFDRDGIGVRTGTTARAVRHDGISFTVDLSDGTEVAGRRPAGGHRPAHQPGRGRSGRAGPGRDGPGHPGG